MTALDQQALEAAREVYEQAFPGAYVTFDGMEAAIAAYLAAFGDGWRLVPVEPTPEMLKAGMDDLGWWAEPYEAPRESGVPVDSDMTAEDAGRINAMQLEVVASTFRAMLAAAPTPPGEKK